MKTKEAPRVVRVTLDEFELEDGRVFRVLEKIANDHDVLGWPFRKQE